MTSAGVVDRLVSAFTSTDAEGRIRFARVDVEDVLAVLILSLPEDKRALDRESTELLGRFAQRAKVSFAEGADGAWAAINRYLEAHPLQPELVEALNRVAREALAAGGDVGSALSRFADEKRTGVLGGGGARPEGTVPAGPLARFLSQNKK